MEARSSRQNIPRIILFTKQSEIESSCTLGQTLPHKGREEGGKRKPWTRTTTPFTINRPFFFLMIEVRKYDFKHPIM